jgi:hypothetical protein
MIDEFYGGADPYAPNPHGVAIPEDAPLDTDADEDDPCHWLFEGQRVTVSPLFNMLCEWITDCYREPVNRYENFDLYKKIARQMRSTLPLAQLRRPHFAQYETTDAATRSTEAFYNLTALPSVARAPSATGYHSDTSVPAHRRDTETQRPFDQDLFGGWDSGDSGPDSGESEGSDADAADAADAADHHDFDGLFGTTNPLQLDTDATESQASLLSALMEGLDVSTGPPNTTVADGTERGAYSPRLHGTRSSETHAPKPTDGSPTRE